MRSWTITLLLVAAAQSAEAKPFGGRLPVDARFYVGTPDLGRLKKRAREGPLGSIWSDPRLKPFVLAFESRFSARRPEDVSVLDLFALVDGEVALAGVPRGQVGYIDAGPKAALFEALLRRYHQQQARDLPILERTERVGGRTIHVRRRMGSLGTLAHVRIGSAFCFAEDPLALKALVAGPVREADFGDADLVLWVAPEYWLGGLDMAEALGLDAVREITGRILLTEEGVRSEAFVRVEGERRGILRILDRSVPGLGPPAILPPDAVAATTVSIDYRVLLQELARMRPDLGGAFDAETRALRQVYGIDLEDDIVGALGDDVTVAFLPPRDLGSDAIPSRWGDAVIVQELARPRNVERFFERIGVPRRDGVWLLPGERFGAVTVLDGHLVLAERAETLRRIARPGPGAPDPAVFEHVPHRRAVFSFVDPRAMRLPLLDAFASHLGVSTFALSSEPGGLRLTWFAALH